MSKIVFGATVKVPTPHTSDDELDVVVTADITPGDPGGRHCPPSGPIPEIESVIIDPHANVDGTKYSRGEDVILLLGEEDIFQLEDHAISAYIEEAQDLADMEPDDDDRWNHEAEEDYLAHFTQ